MMDSAWKHRVLYHDFSIGPGNVLGNSERAHTIVRYRLRRHTMHCMDPIATSMRYNECKNTYCIMHVFLSYHAWVGAAKASKAASAPFKNTRKQSLARNVILMLFDEDSSKIKIMTSRMNPSFEILATYR